METIHQDEEFHDEDIFKLEIGESLEDNMRYLMEEVDAFDLSSPRGDCSCGRDHLFGRSLGCNSHRMLPMEPSPIQKEALSMEPFSLPASAMTPGTTPQGSRSCQIHQTLR